VLMSDYHYMSVEDGDITVINTKKWGYHLTYNKYSEDI
jgi:hypothetical protein